MKVLTKKRTRTAKEGIKSVVFWLLVVIAPALLIAFLLWSNLSETKLQFFQSPPDQSSLQPPTAPQLSWLSTKGARIVDENGKNVILRGVNVADLGWGGDEGWLPSSISVAVRSWKANVIRVRIYEERFFADPAKYLNRLESQVVAPARREGVYVILHPFLKDRVPLPTRRTGEMWRLIAQKYKDDPVVLYDPLDEPHDVDFNRIWTAYQGLIEEIRAIHPKSLIFVSGLDWGREINSYVERALPYPNIVYRTNPYNEPDAFESKFGQAVGKLPVFIGEFGADGYPSMSREAVKTLLSYAVKHDLGWAAWTFHSTGCPCLLANSKNLAPTPYGEIVRDALLESREPL